YDPISRPGVANLLRIAAALRRLEVSRLVESELPSLGVTDHHGLKQLVADLVISELRPIRKEYDRLIANQEYLVGVLDEGASRAKRIAEETWAGIRRCLDIEV